MSGLRLGDQVKLLQAINGAPTYLGSIVTTSAAAKNNSDTAVAFNGSAAPYLKGKMLLIQTSGVCYILPVSSASGAVTSANGIKLAADERVILTMDGARGFLSVIRDSSDVTVKVWELM